MPPNNDGHVVAFVWQPGEINPGLVRMTSRTGTVALVDLSRLTPEETREVLLGSQMWNSAVHVKVSPTTFMDPSFGELLHEGGVSGVWLELHRFLLTVEVSAFVQRVKEVSKHRPCFPVLSDMGLIMEMLDEGPRLANIVLKGCEASGFTSGESTLILYSAVREAVSKKRDLPRVLIWGGVATAEAAAAFLSRGAGGIVFESLHWLTDMVAGDDGFKRQIQRLQPDNTELVGRDLGVPCRLFNKGNSPAIKALKAESASLREKGAAAGEQRAFATRLAERTVLPAQSRFKGHEVIPLGVEASFAHSFASRYGCATGPAIEGFIADTEALIAEADEKKRGFLDGMAIREMGIRYPFIQGAMTWITDMIPFALAVADAGALPTLALGLMDRETLAQRLGGLGKAMEGRSYAVNILALPENPFLEAQLEWIREHRPPFVVIAAGNPSHVGKIKECGCEPIYISPREDLLRLAFEAGARYVICEGNEAGGHLGSYTTLTLAQKVSELRRREPHLFRDRVVILAGGMWNGETVSIAALLGAGAVQMGTAYLATAEIVQTGALSELYQRMILNSPWGGTVVTGEAWGMPVRSLISPKIKAIQALEIHLIEGHADRPSFRRQLENLTAGSLLIAARGVDSPGSAPMKDATRLEQGQFMSGACAGLINQVKSLHAFHRELAEELAGAARSTHQAPLQEAVGREEVACRRDAPPASGVFSHRRGINLRNGPERIGITGMSITNSLGNSPPEVWLASTAMKSGITHIPPSKWDHQMLYDPRPLTPERTYCRVGAFKDLAISRKELGISPHDFRTMSRSTRETLHLAQKAIEDSGILSSDIPRERIAVIVSQNAGEFAGNLEDIILRVSSKKIVDCVRRALPLTPQLEAAIEEEVRCGRRVIDDTTLVGRLNATAAGFICRRYGFMGPSFAVSAACASSLAAVYSALQMMRNGTIDAAVVGGGEEDLTPVHFLEFSALGVLAGLSGIERHPRESSRPFDAARDGIVLGEGGAMVVLERESTAARRGVRCHAYLTGMGASNNHLGLVEPSCLAQEMAVRSSFRDTGDYGPQDVDLVECHATATVQGDGEEVKALKKIYHREGCTRIVSFKSQIGHTLGASGLNSLIRGIMAMREGTFPPTLNCDSPDRELCGEAVGLMVSREPSDWKTKNGAPRRLQVNAFGFGGSNYVAQVEEARESSDIVLVSRQTPGDLKIRGAGSEMVSGLFLAETVIAGEPYRVASIAPSAEEARVKILAALDGPEANPLTPKKLRNLARKGIHLNPAKGSSPPVAFIFPGQGSQYPGMGRGLYEAVPAIREGLDRLARQVDFDLLSFLFSTSEEELQNTRWLQPALFCLEFALAQYLLALGLRPVAVAGHSLGEFTALCTAGVYSFEEGLQLVSKRAQCMERVVSLHPDAGTMLAVNAPLEMVKTFAERREGITISNINAPDQVVVAGGSDQLRALHHELRENQVRSTLLKVGMAFHSPVMKAVRAELEGFVASLSCHPPRLPVISNTTGKPFPDDPEVIRKIVIAHLESPVHWEQSVRCLGNDCGAQLFVEMGPGGVLSNLIGSTLSGAECIETCLPPAENMTFKTALARLYAHGCLGHEKPAGFVHFSAAMPQPQSHNEFSPPPPSQSVAEAAGLTSLVHKGTEAGDMMEELIAIIMDATGYERDEIDPDMDLKEELAIRSSRLPVIMDAAERHFGITIQFEDFIGVRTIRDMVAQVSRLAASGPGNDRGRVAASPARLLERGSEADASAERAELKRVVFDQLSLGMGRFHPVELSAGDRVAIFGAGRPTRVSKKLSDIFTGDYGLRTVSYAFMKRTSDWGVEGFDVCKESEWFEAASGLAGLPSLAGLVFVVDELVNKRTKGPRGIAKLLEAVFVLLQAFLNSPARKFVFLVHHGKHAHGFAEVLKEGVLGMYLGAALEYGSVQFRTLVLDDDTDLGYAIRCALDRSRPEVETHYRRGEAFTSAGRVVPLPLGGDLDVDLAPGDVVVFSGGGHGITSHLARALIPFAPRMVLVGRTPLDDGVDYDALLEDAHPGEGRIGHMISRTSPELSQEEMKTAVSRALKSLEVIRLVKDLKNAGMDVEYRSCDVVDEKEVGLLVRDLVKRYGKIDGIIHGAGAISDGLLMNLTSADFSAVADVKLHGAWNLFKAAEKCGLRFFTVLSSVVAAVGNPGQTNYCAASRAVSALVKMLGRSNGRVRCTSLLLPPIAGAGMADNPEIRELMRIKGMEDAYLDVSELKELFCRELVTVPTVSDTVLFMRRLPAVPTARLNAAGPPPDSETLRVGTVNFRKQDFPLIDSVPRCDVGSGTLQAHRTFSKEKDLWIADHKPFKFLRNPLVSGVMVLEAFMEAARLLYPYLKVQGIQRAQFLDLLECPSARALYTAIACTRIRSENRQVICEASFSSPGPAHLEGQPGMMRLNHKAHIILSGLTEFPWDQLAGFPVSPSELDSPAVPGDEILRVYEEKYDFKGRYRVLSYVEGAGAGVIRGRTTCREERDFSAHPITHYQYSPYLLEAVFHLVAYHVMITREGDSRPVVPFEIKELMLHRKARHGEEVLLEGRMTRRDESGASWDARCIDGRGRPLMQIRGLRMQRLSG